ncbi:hypothetical protein [Halofilum ochraceum]|uniref:hypothetical protein n=1 Tax=Halofilum ochraceum TaxID=1611323 RepID=UPI00082D31E6|nr:hypothetical protein [Halofilum ochraceum]
MDNIDRLQQPQLDALVAAGSIRSVTVERAPGEGWAVRVRYGMREAVMASQHRPVRIWRSLDTIGEWMEKRGIGHWEVRAG